MTPTRSLDRAPALDDIRRTREAIDPYILQTPVFTSEHIDNLVGASVFFKCENFQKVGAFKMRGAANAALALGKAELECGLATHSSGNHAQAVARTASLFNVPAFIVMPTNAPRTKVEATRSYGANITFCEPTLEARETTLEAVRSETGATFIHPYDNYDVIAGQGTAGLELLEAIPDLDAVITPVGGGGLLSGTAIALKDQQPTMRVFGAEPKRVDDAKRSLDSGTRQVNIHTDTIADGLKTNLGERNLDIMLRMVDDILTVSEEEIISAMIDLWQYMKVVVEPSAAVPLAGLLKNRDFFHNKKVGIVLSGGNIDLNALPF